MTILYWILKAGKWAFYVGLAGVMIGAMLQSIINDGFGPFLRGALIVFGVMLVLTGFAYLIHIVEQKTGREL